MPAGGVQHLKLNDQSGLVVRDAALERVKAEGWTRLALIGEDWAELADRLVASGWSNAQVFVQTGPLRKVFPKRLTELSALTTLDLRVNFIGDAGAEAISAMSNLRSLSLGDNDIGDAGASALSQLSALSSLSLDHNDVGDAGAVKLARLTNLTALDLAYNHVGDVGAAELAQLNTLNSLNLKRNKIGKAGARAILNSWADPETADRRRFLDLRENADLEGILPTEVCSRRTRKC